MFLKKNWKLSQHSYKRLYEHLIILILIFIKKKKKNKNYLNPFFFLETL